MVRFVPGRPILSAVAPVRIAMPVQEADEAIIDFMDKPPGPIPPKRLEPFDGRTTDARLAALQIRGEPMSHAMRHFFIDPAVLLKTDRPADPGVIRLVPHTPVPVAHDVPAPLFDAIPNDIGALV